MRIFSRNKYQRLVLALSAIGLITFGVGASAQETSDQTKSRPVPSLERIAEQLDISEEQRQEIQERMQELAQSDRARRKEMRAQRADREERRQERRVPPRVREMAMERRVEREQVLAQVLSEEQFEQYKSLQQERAANRSDRH